MLSENTVFDVLVPIDVKAETAPKNFSWLINQLCKISTVEKHLHISLPSGETICTSIIKNSICSKEGFVFITESGSTYTFIKI